MTQFFKMTTFLDTEHGIPTLLASIAVILALNLFAKIGEFLWGFVKKKAEISEQSIEKLTAALQVNTQAVQNLDHLIAEGEQTISEIPKFKQGLRRLFVAVKHIAGDEWTDVRKIIMDDEAGL